MCTYKFCISPKKPDNTHISMLTEKDFLTRELFLKPGLVHFTHTAQHYN